MPTQYGPSREVVVLLDGTGEVEMASDAALRWLSDAGVRSALRTAVAEVRTDVDGPRVKTRVVSSDGTHHSVTIVRLRGVDERFLALGAAPQQGAEGIQARLRLTPAQRRVCELLVTGATLSDIAAALGVGAETVKSHTKAIYARLDVSTRVELVRALRDE